MTEPTDKRTPVWAYDEDGYCVACGNGWWRWHMPDCELADWLDNGFRAFEAGFFASGEGHNGEYVREKYREGTALDEYLRDAYQRYVVRDR